MRATAGPVHDCTSPSGLRPAAGRSPRALRRELAFLTRSLRERPFRRPAAVALGEWADAQLHEATFAAWTAEHPDERPFVPDGAA